MSVHQYRKPWKAIQYFIYHPDLKYFLRDCFWPPNFREICFFFNPQQLKIKLGWETLNKYMPYFPNSRCALYTNDSTCNEIVILTLINKKNILTTVVNHLEDFQTTLQAQGIQPEDLLDNKMLHRFIKTIDTNGLFGTLLGYGRDNAFLYENYKDKNRSEWALSSPWAELEEAHLERLNKKDLSFEPWDLSDLFYPPFACNPNSEETKILKQTYTQEKEEIVKYFEGKDVVEAALSLFNQN